MHFSKLSSLAILAACLGVDAMGINCKGSSNCRVSRGSAKLLRARVADMLHAGYGQRTFENGEHIACVMDICAFFQNYPPGGDLNLAYTKINELMLNGCDKCGSAPIESGTDVSQGELTINFVRHAVDAPIITGDENLPTHDHVADFLNGKTDDFYGDKTPQYYGPKGDGVYEIDMATGRKKLVDWRKENEDKEEASS